MTRCLMLATALIAAGCAHDQQSAPVAAAPPPAPPPVRPAPPVQQVVYSKAGASQEEFYRTESACRLRQMEAQNAATADSWGWIAVYRLCMRANGWVLVPKK